MVIRRKEELSDFESEEEEELVYHSSDQEDNSDEEDEASDPDDQYEQSVDDDDEEENTQMKAAELAKLKRDLAHVSFEQLADVKGKMGEKEFSDNSKVKKISKDQILKDLEGAVKKIKKTNKVKLSKEEMKRKDKHRPMEVSSKRAVSRFREVVPLQAEKRRDPRFDKLSGHFNKDLFEKSYGFLKDYKNSEMEMLKQRLKKEKNPEKQEEMKHLLQKMMTTERQEEEKKRKEALFRQRKKQEAELVKQGKKPYFLKRSEKRKLDLMDRYEKLGEKKVDRILEKRRKRNAAKDKKHLPFKRRSAADA
ncbi:hypothetical protein BDF20DRAFT_845435 [Mycotypha africana]|uniref:uncharacterized protein n=1 Tax=Mycotypha africana TaxID=64632 RepID=UPI0023018C7E|nr:uncharacterized protein BDF20DRAFT_845435 [Mycotypha africana]KAI8991596.1 hypothetical protein BDF20DRAFT_845435 [Mycotypha africana]